MRTPEAREIQGMGRCGRDDGFTLLEVIVALVIAATAVLGLVQVAVSNLNAVAAARDRTIAACLVRSKLEDIARNGERYGAESAGSFGAEHPSFVWRSSKQPTRWPELSRAKVTVRWTRGSIRKELSAETLIRVDKQTRRKRGELPEGQAQ